jgi:hypothetical protein
MKILLNIKMQIYIVFLLFFLNHLNSQTIVGRILDSELNPLPYSTIELGKNYGVITNEEGFFSIDVSSFHSQDSVRVSCLGFNKQEFLLKNFISKDYILETKTHLLDEVVLTNNTLSVKQIMLNVFENLSKNYKYDLSSYKLFSRRTEHINGKEADFKVDESTGFSRNQLQLFNSEFDKLEKSLLNNTSKQYIDLAGDLYVFDQKKSKMIVKKAIRFIDEDNNQSIKSLFEKCNEIVLKHIDKTKNYKIKSGWFTLSKNTSLGEKQRNMSDSLRALSFVKKAMHSTIKNHSFEKHDPFLDFIIDQKKYHYKLDEITYLDSEKIYVISFFPKRFGGKFEGRLFVSGDSFAVIKLEYNYYEDRVGKKINLKLLFGIKYVEQNKKGFAVYKKAIDGFYFPCYISEQAERYFYINRPFKFIDKDNGRNKVDFDFLIEGIYNEKNEFLIIEKTDLDKSKYNSLLEKKVIDYETHQKYDPTIWKDYSIIEPLEEMKLFKKYLD